MQQTYPKNITLEMAELLKEVKTDVVQAEQQNMLDALDKKLNQRNHRLSIRTKVGRNDPCPCNSGRKFKKCCINKTVQV